MLWVQASDTPVNVEHHQKAEANIIVPGLPYTKLCISLPYQRQIKHYAFNLPSPSISLSYQRQTKHYASNLPLPSPPFSSFIFAPPPTFPLALLLHLASFPGLLSAPVLSLIMLTFALGLARPSAQPFRLSVAHAPQEEI